MTALIFDTETHDSKEPEIIEAAWVEVSFGNPTIIDPVPIEEEEGTVFSEQVESVRLKPSKPITLGALATHHIMDEDLTKCQPSSTFKLPSSDYLIGHNVDFDWQAAGSPPGAKRICTLALCRELWPEADSHTQSAMLYLLDRANARKRLRNAHSAAYDVFICKTILDAIIAKVGVKSWEELWTRSESARIPKVMTFGKHKGVPMADVPADYKRWLLGQPDVDDYLRIALGGKPKLL